MPKPKTSNLVLAGIGLALLLTGCGPGRQRPEPLPALAKRSTACQGRGYLTSDTSDDRLLFRFACHADSGYVQFRDLLGRKVFYLQIEGDSLQAWDLQNNRRYAGAGTVVLPSAGAISGCDLLDLLRGGRPSREDAMIDFSYAQTGVGLTVEKAIFKADNSPAVLELHFTQRQFGGDSASLKMTIPVTVPLAQPE